MFKRKIYVGLKKWKEEADGSTAIMIEDARRVGKSTVAEAFAQNEYKDYILIDFSTASADIKNNFENINNLDVFFRNLFILTGKKLEKRNGVIIFDEVQLFPKARQSIKYLVKDGRFDQISQATGLELEKIKELVVLQKKTAKSFLEISARSDNEVYALRF